jgi:hypothetical protein
MKTTRQGDTTAPSIDSKTEEKRLMDRLIMYKRHAMRSAGHESDTTGNGKL